MKKSALHRTRSRHVPRHARRASIARASWVAAVVVVVVGLALGAGFGWFAWLFLNRPVVGA